MALILASGSPRRRELLQQLALGNADFKFDIVLPDIDETLLPHELPQDFVVRLAQEKAQAGLKLWCNTSSTQSKTNYAIGSDTIVVLNQQVLGKPKDKQDAAKMLRSLSGKTHHVMTAVAITNGIDTHHKLVVTAVTFTHLTSQNIDSYIETQEPMDKAGAYGIQGVGGNFVSKIDGSYSAVVGLPLVETQELLQLLYPK